MIEYAHLTDEQRRIYDAAADDCVGRLMAAAAREQNSIIAAGLRVAVGELRVMRQEQAKATA